MKIVAIVQARMGSTRLPGKVLAPLHGRPLLEWVMQRTAMASTVNQVVVATTINREDDAIAAFAEQSGFAVFRGSQDNVLARFHLCARAFGADLIVRITADDPLKDPEIIDDIVRRLIAADADYCSNTIHPSFPEGLDVEAFTADALARAFDEAKLPSEHEHVTPYIWKNPAIFRIDQLSLSPDRSAWRWTVDDPADLAFVDALLTAAGPRMDIGYRDLIDIVERSEELLGKSTNRAVRNAGYLKSLDKEQTLS